MIRRPPRSTQSRSSAASDVYKRQCAHCPPWERLHRGSGCTLGARRPERRVHPGVSHCAIRLGTSSAAPASRAPRVTARKTRTHSGAGTWVTAASWSASDVRPLRRRVPASSRTVRGAASSQNQVRVYPTADWAVGAAHQVTAATPAPNTSSTHRPNRLRTLSSIAVSYTHLRAHETRHDLVCRLLLEKK